MGRPRGTREVRFSVDELEKVARTMATQPEIAAKLKVSLATLERRLQEPKFRLAYEMARAELRISLRTVQFQRGMGIDHNGNRTKTPDVQMLKWLGEQYLGQAHAHRLVDEDGKDRPIHDVSAVELLNARIASILERKRESGGTPGV